MEKEKKLKLVRKSVIITVIIIVIPILAGMVISSEVTTFNDGESTINLRFPLEFQRQGFFIRVPNGTVSEARMMIRGFDMLGQKGLPKDVVLVTDTSGSMDDNCGPDGRAQVGESPCKINDVKSADIHFLNNVDMNYVQVGLIHYSTSAVVDSVLSTDRTGLVNLVNTYSANGWTNIGDALRMAINELNSTRAQRTGTQKYIILMTDGWANCLEGSSNCRDTVEYNARAEEWALSLAYQAAANNIIIYAISFGECGAVYTPGSQTGAHCEFMDQLAAITKGVSYNAPEYSPSELIAIYDEIAEMISTQDFPTPTINSTSPLVRFGWSYPAPYSGNALWNGASCGVSSASCRDFRALIQNNLNACASANCEIWFSAFSTTVGMLNLSDLYIEINEPPKTVNLPPTGGCPSRSITCPETQLVVNMDDGVLVSDPNDELSTLTWFFHHSTPSPGGAFFSMNQNYNSERKLIFTVDPAHLNENFWEVYYFNVSDPWGEVTTVCINVSYNGCAQRNAVLDISDRTISFDISYYPWGYKYNLSDMIDQMTNLACSKEEIGFVIWTEPTNFTIYGPNEESTITIIPNNPDWYNPTSQTLEVEAYCLNQSAGDYAIITKRGNADVVLITDFSGSMKKALNSWLLNVSQGTGVKSCAEIYLQSNEVARKSHLARCLDEEFIRILMSYQGNRIWPEFIHKNQIVQYTLNPNNTAQLVDYVLNFGPQGMDQTCLACAVNDGYNLLSQYSNDRRNKFIVLMTDGLPTHCALGSCISTATSYGQYICEGFCDTQGQDSCDESTIGCTNEGCLQAEQNTIFSSGRAVQDLDTMMYTVAFGLIEQCPRNEILLKTIAELGGGEYHHSSDVTELRRIYNDIANKIVEISKVEESYEIHTNVRDKANLTIIYRAPSPTCGNGRKDNPAEECDDGNKNNDDTCSNICTLTFCKDGIVQQPNGRESIFEECDDGNEFDGDSCSNQCISQYCGDGIPQPGLGEQCDNGFGYFNDECLENCMRGIPAAPRCGDNSTDVGEECDDGCYNGNPLVCDTADNGDGCNQFCRLEHEPILRLNNATISFDYSAFPGYKYALENMVQRRFVTLPCPDESFEFSISPSLNFSITNPINPHGNITIAPNNPDWTTSTSDKALVELSCYNNGVRSQSSAYLTIIYTAIGAPQGRINCASPTPRYLLRGNAPVRVGLEEIFSFEGEYGSIDKILVESSTNVVITHDKGLTPEESSISVQSNSFLPFMETIRVRVLTNNGVYSGYCPVVFFDMASNCDKTECDACIISRDLDCFSDNICLADNPVLVLNPFTPVRASRYVPAMAPPNYDADFKPLEGSGFVITHLSGSGSTEIFNVSGQNVENGVRDASVMTYTFEGYQGSVRVCPLLIRLNFDVGEESFDPLTDLLITGSRAIIGFYEWGGIRSKGPYIFTAKVWLR